MTISARGDFGKCLGLSATATGAVLNVTTVNASASSFLTVWPADKDRPLASNLNWVAGQAATPNQVTTGLDASGRLSLFNSSGTIDVIVDIVGLYEPAAGGGGAGATGPKGDNGDAGANGTNGAKGDKGDTGAPGTNGAPGAPGANGTNGTNGTNGAKGDTGDRGAAGSQLMMSSNPDTSSNNGQFSSTQLDAFHNPVISHFSSTELRLTHCADPACISSVTNTVDTGFAGKYSSLELDAAGFPVISYYDSDAKVLKLAHCNNADCAGVNNASVVPVDGGPHDVGQFSSLALDVDGSPVISYYDATDLKLNLAHCSDPACANGAVITTVAVPGEEADWVGQFSSVALDTAGNPIIAYYNETAGALKLVYCADPDCTLISSAPTVDIGGSDLSMALDSVGNPVMAYAVGDGTLKVAHCGGTECATLSFGQPQSGLLGNPLGTSLAVDKTDFPVVSYIDDSGPQLFMRVIHCSDAACGDSVSTTPDPVIAMPMNTSIALDVNGIPTISRFDSSPGQLTVTHCVNPDCLPHTRVLQP